VTDSGRPADGRPAARVLAPLYLSVFLLVAGESALHVLVSPYLSRELGLGPAAIGVVVAVFGVASLAARLPAGAAYSRARGRRLLLFGGALSSGAFLLVPLVAGPVPFALLMGLDGFGWSIATTVQLAALVGARPEGMPTASAIGWYSGFTGLGHTAGAALAGFGADRVGFDASFIALGCIVALGTVVMARALPRGTVHPRAGAPVPAPRAVRVRRRLASSRVVVGQMPLAVWIGFLVMVYINFINAIQTTFHPLLALGAGLTLTQIGILASCRSWSSSIVRLGSGALFARIGTPNITMPLMIVGAATLVLLPTVRASFLLQVPLFVAAGLARGLLRVTGSTDAFEAVGRDEERQGLTAALVQSGLDLGRLLGPLIGGVVAQLWGLATMFQVLPVALLLPYLVLLARARRSGRLDMVRANG
jgi:predicted MFS family arabinose efflux permease